MFTGELIEVSGQPSIGKTQVINNNYHYFYYYVYFFCKLCLNVSAQTIAHTRSTVAYIDTNGSFSPSRLNELIPIQALQQVLLLFQLLFTTALLL